MGARPEETYFWATHAGAELDLLIVRGRWRLGFELKRTALDDLGLERVDVIYPGDHTLPLAERVRAVALSRLHGDLEPLG